jgi:ribosomal protein S18 acetylase RimI-like enzyme
MDVNKTIDINTRLIKKSDSPWIAKLLTERWGSTEIVTRARVHRASRLLGFLAELDGKPSGLLIYNIEAGECEIISLDSLSEGRGVGIALLQAVEDMALSHACKRLWLITTNDNTHAIDYYQKRGFTLVAIHKGAVSRARVVKSEIPTHNQEGVPIEDEWEFERPLS